MAWLAPVEGMSAASSTCRRIAVAPGVEVLIDEQHPAFRLNGDTRRHRRGAASGAGIVVGSNRPSGEPVDRSGMERRSTRDRDGATVRLSSGRPANNLERIRHEHDCPAGRPCGDCPVGGGRLQRARLTQEPGRERLEADRRAAQAPARSDPQPGEHGQGRDGLRALHARRGDLRPEPRRRSAPGCSRRPRRRES